MLGFGKRLIAAREAKGYKQNQLAETLGITATRLNYWEKDKREPDFYMFCKIIETLDVDPNYLLGIKPHKEEFDQTMSAYNKLNSLGKQKAADYIQDLSEQEKYSRSNPEPPQGTITNALSSSKKSRA